MAASTKPVNGQQYVVQVSNDGGTTFKTLGWQQDCNISFNGETRELSSKTTCYWREYAPAASSWTTGGTAGLGTDFTPEISNTELFTYMNTEVDILITAVNCADGQPIVAENEWAGKGIITELTLDFPDKDTATYTYQFQGSGMPTQTAIPV